MRTSLVALAARAVFLPRVGHGAYQFGEASTCVRAPDPPPPATLCFSVGSWGVRWVWDPRFTRAVHWKL